MLAVNAVVEVLPNRPFQIHVSNWGNSPRILCKRTIVAYAHGRPALLLAPVPWEDPHQDTSEASPLQEDDSVVEAGQCPEQSKDWRLDVNLDHVQDDALRHDILEMLEKHCSMWDGKLIELTSFEHRIDTLPATKPVRAQPYRMGPDCGASVEAELARMLNLGVIEPTMSEWASPIVIVSKRTARHAFAWITGASAP